MDEITMAHRSLIWNEYRRRKKDIDEYEAAGADVTKARINLDQWVAEHWDMFPPFYQALGLVFADYALEHFGLQAFLSVKPSEVDVREVEYFIEYVPVDDPSPIVKSRTKRLPLTLFGHPSDGRIDYMAIGYAPEIDTLFYMKV